MAAREIFITQFDMDRLRVAIGEAEAASDWDTSHLLGLRRELERATLVSSEEIPPNVITMNSKVLLRDEDNGEESTYTLVFPEDADIDSGAISVLAPVGTAILGYSEGDTVEWPVPSGTRRLSVEKVIYQPEAAGDFHL